MKLLPVKAILPTTFSLQTLNQPPPFRPSFSNTRLWGEQEQHTEMHRTVTEKLILRPRDMVKALRMRHHVSLVSLSSWIMLPASINVWVSCKSNPPCGKQSLAWKSPLVVWRWEFPPNAPGGVFHPHLAIQFFNTHPRWGTLNAVWIPIRGRRVGQGGLLLLQRQGARGSPTHTPFGASAYFVQRQAVRCV